LSSAVNIVYLGIGAASGAMVRYGVGLALPFSTQQFAWATFTVNIMGCLLIGFLSQIIDQAWLRMLLITGFLGAFTTFSGLGYELYQYFKASQWQLLSLYALLSIIFSILFVFLGSKCALYLQS
jgi:fluoride exporter